MTVTCTVKGCTAPMFARGWCQPHYHRWYRYGGPQVGEPKKP